MARVRPAALAATLLLAACGASEEPAPTNEAAAAPETVAPPPLPVSDPSAPKWDLQSSGEGVALVYPAAGDTAIRLFCPAERPILLVNVPGFHPVGSEEWMTFGSGGTVHMLVADTRGDALRGGVSGTSAVPGDLAALLGGPVAVNYGAQDAGPYLAPPAGLVRNFVTACNDGAPTPTPTAKPTSVSACLMQGDERLTNPPLRAVGTEPFWAAEIEGRCVTYSHPENQNGTRVWTRYAAGPRGGGTWTGALDGKPFVLRTRPQTGCSDGMSDRRYPLAAELTVGGEERRGCAEGG